MTGVKGWTGHNGDECPVNEKAVVDIRLRSGLVIENTVAGRWLWNRPRREETGVFVASKFENGGMVIAYREAEEMA